MQLKKSVKNKRGFAALQGIVLSIVLVAITIGLGLMILGEFKGAMVAGSEEANATAIIIEKIATIPNWIGILIIVAIAGIILSYLMGWLGGRSRRGG